MNPRVMQAFADIQRATQVLVTEAPDLARVMGIPQGLLGNAATTTGSTPAANPPTTTNAGAGRGVMDFASMMQQMNLVRFSILMQI